MGFAAVGQLTRRCGRLCGASLSLGSVLHHQTSTGRPLAGLASCERPCLVDGGFPPSGPQEDLTYCMSHLVVLCSCRAHQGYPSALRGLDSRRALPRISIYGSDGLPDGACEATLASEPMTAMTCDDDQFLLATVGRFRTARARCR